MTDTLLSAGWVPFTTACALLFALSFLELVFAFVGLSLIGDVDADADLGADVPDIGDLGDLDIDLDADVADYEIPDVSEADAVTTAAADGASGPLAWLGLGRLPFVIWMASNLFAFSAVGFALQSLSQSILGGPLPAGIAIIPAVLGAIVFTNRFGRLFVAILPKSETTSMSTRRYGGHKGTVTQGVARQGHPAEVRITDRHGNWHYLRAEPLEQDAAIKAGTDVLILRNRRTGEFKITALSRG